MQDRFRVYGREGEPCPALRNADRQDPDPPVAARGTAPPASDSTRLRPRPLVEQSVALEPPELGVAADRLAVDHDLRDRPAAGEIEELLAKRRIVVEKHVLVLEPLPSSSAFARTQ